MWTYPGDCYNSTWAEYLFVFTLYIWIYLHLHLPVCSVWYRYITYWCMLGHIL